MRPRKNFDDVYYDCYCMKGHNVAFLCIFDFYVFYDGPVDVQI